MKYVAISLELVEYSFVSGAKFFNEAVSGFAFMVSNKTDGWKMPEEFAKNESSNFVKSIFSNKSFESEINQKITGLFK